MLRDVEIHAARIGFERCAIFRRQIRIDTMRRVAKLQHALRLVVAKQRRAHDLGEFAIRAAAICVHLPQAILRGHVALRDKHVFLRGCVDVGNSVLIAANGNRSGERRLETLRREMNVAVE